MQLPLDVYNRFNAYTGNGQSALLQEVKGYLEGTYYQSRIRADGQVAVVEFNSLTIEVVPVFKYDDSGSWLQGFTYQSQAPACSSFAPIALCDHKCQILINNLR